MRERTGRKLGILPVAGSLSAEDVSVLDEKLSALQRQLAALSIANIDFDDGVDEAYADIIVDMLAALSVDDFMLTEPKRTKLAVEGILGLPNTSVAERRLRKVLQAPLISPPVVAEYF